MQIHHRRRRNPAAPSAPREVIVLDNGKRLTGRLMHNAFVWSEEILTPAQWAAALAEAEHSPHITVVKPRERNAETRNAPAERRRGAMPAARRR